MMIPFMFIRYALDRDIGQRTADDCYNKYVTEIVMKVSEPIDLPIPTRV